MSGPKFRSGVDFARALATTLPSATATASATASARSGGTTSHAQLKEAFFQQSGMSLQMRRGPIQRMPLRPAKAGRSGTARGPGRVGNQSDEPDFDLPADEIPADHALKNLPVEFRSRQESNSGNQEGGDRDERRLQKLFSMSPIQASATAATGVVAATGDVAARARALKKADAITLAPLPDIRSLRDVLQLIQSTGMADPTGKSVPVLLRRINAAVLQNKITIPRVDKIADARELLIEIFGKGHQGAVALSPTQRSMHAMLPLWLLNLGRERTLTQQTQAAARLSLPRTHSNAAAPAA